MVGADVFIEDLNSTNGTYINGKADQEAAAGAQRHGRDRQVQDQVPGRRRRRLREDDDHAAGPRRAAAPLAGAAAGRSRTPRRLQRNSGFGTPGQPPRQPASIKVLNGAAAGREVTLTKVVTTVGKPGVQVASITKRPGGYVLAHVEGAPRPTRQRRAAGRRLGAAAQRRRDRARRHADAVHPGLSALNGVGRVSRPLMRPRSAASVATVNGNSALRSRRCAHMRARWHDPGAQHADARPHSARLRAASP